MMKSPNVYVDLIKLTSDCKGSADFSKVLERLADFAGASGCIIWEKFYAGTSNRRYFKLADWFPHETREPLWFFLPEACETGIAIETPEIRRVPDIAKAWREGSVPRGDLLLARGVHAFTAFPISFGPRREAAIDFYWKQSYALQGEEEAGIREAASVVPDLLHSVLNKVGFEVLQNVETRLNEARPDASGAEVASLLDTVLEEISMAFNARETTIFLEDRNVEPGVFRRYGTKWPWKTFPPAPSYLRTDGGLTPWVIRHNQTLRFVDLSHFEEERLARRTEDPNSSPEPAIFDDLTWPTQNVLLAELSTEDRPRGEMEGEPLSFLCVPIRDGDRKVRGALRCCGTTKAPFLFDERHIQILELIAEKIGHWWSSRMALEAERQDTFRFKALVNGVSAMHGIVARSLTEHEKPKITPLWDKALEMLAGVLPWPDALSIRMVRGQELVYEAHRGKRWTSEMDKRSQTTTYKLSENWAGARAVNERRVLKEDDPGRVNGLRSHLFPDATRLIHAPILSGDRAIGVIDVRGFDRRPFPPHVDDLCDLVGRQLGLYHHLQETFWKLKSRESELFRQKEDQSKTYEDFVHQLRNPLVKAGILAERIPNRNLPDLNQIRTYLRHANLFADTINYFVSLAKDERIDTSLEVMKPDELVSTLVQMGEDQETTLIDKRGIRFTVDRPSFEALHRVTIYYSKHLFVHCIFNLLDNAAKYSKSNTEVVIRARAEKDRFVISVINTVLGHRIEVEDRKRLVKRGERGRRAGVTTASGRGIGLYIVERFMAAMNGELIILPTDSRDRNTFSLSFRSGLPKGLTVLS